MVVNETKIRNRSEIPDQYKWNAASVFENWAAWEKATEELVAMLPDAQKYQGRLNEGADVLTEFLQVREDISRLMMKIYFYAAMSANVDSTDSKATAASNRAGGLFGRVLGAISFMNPELLAIGQDTLNAWMDENDTLSPYRQFVDNLFRQQDHVRSSEVEQVLGMLQSPFGSVSDIFDMLTSNDMMFEPATGSDGTTHDVAQGTIDTLLDSRDREVRRTAWENYTGQYLAHKNTIATTYLTSVKQDVFDMQVRGYNSSMEASLFENNIPVEVFHNLIDTYKKNIPTWHKYWAVRRKALGYDELHPYDIWAPINNNPPVLTFEQAVDWISEGMKPLGEDYVNALRKGCLEERWVDVYPNVGKRAGAFSYGTYDTHPFIMMSFDDSMSGMSTLAHELGHSMHSYLSRKHQPSTYAGYSLFLAEIASNFNQAMTRAYLREQNDDPNFQVALIEEAMNNFHRYFFIMPTLARFELEVHERVERGEGVTSDDMIDLMVELFKEGYGEEMQIDHDRVGITWATFGHLYNAYYVYQYATGISAAHAFADKILNEGTTMVEKYLGFLSAGSSKYALDVLTDAGLDMTKPDAVETTFGVLADMVDRLEKLTS